MPLTVYLDEHFSADSRAALLREGSALGVGAQAAVLLRPGASDPIQIRFAARRHWTFLTRDKGFLRLHDAWHMLQTWRPLRPVQRHSGILLADCPHVLDDDVMKHVAAFLGSPNRPLLEDALFILVDNGTWFGYHPFAAHQRRPLTL